MKHGHFLLTGIACVLVLFSSVQDTWAGKDGIIVSSTAFKEGGAIPSKYTCKGEDISPPLSWSGIPKGAKTLVLIADDPDAPVGTWVHWVYFDLPPDITGLPENVAKQNRPPPGGKQGTTDFRVVGYGGPCPPSGTHRYYFKVYALDKELKLGSGANKATVEKAMQGHVLAKGPLMGKFSH